MISAEVARGTGFRYETGNENFAHDIHSSIRLPCPNYNCPEYRVNRVKEIVRNRVRLDIRTFKYQNVKPGTFPYHDPLPLPLPLMWPYQWPYHYYHDDLSCKPWVNFPHHEPHRRCDIVLSGNTWIRRGEAFFLTKPFLIRFLRQLLNIFPGASWNRLDRSEAQRICTRRDLWNMLVCLFSNRVWFLTGWRPWSGADVPPVSGCSDRPTPDACLW